MSFNVEFHNLANGRKRIDGYDSAKEAQGDVDFTNSMTAKTQIRARYIGKDKRTVTRGGKEHRWQ